MIYIRVKFTDSGIGVYLRNYAIVYAVCCTVAKRGVLARQTLSYCYDKKFDRVNIKQVHGRQNDDLLYVSMLEP